jgi:CheY-like chemotaxis protein
VSARRPTVLVVDDDAELRVALTELLEAEGYRAPAAADGREALDSCDREKPDLILLDLKMPVMDGWQFLAAWETRTAEARCPIVLMSGFSFIHGAAGVAGFLRKPVEAGRLLTCVRRLLPADHPAETSRP